MSTAHLRIRLASQRDSEPVFTIDRMTIGSDERRSYLKNAIRNNQAFVATMNGRCAGFAVVDRAFYGQSFVWLLVTHPDFRRKGVATTILNHLVSVCRTEKLFTSTNRSNKPMQNLLRKLGFTRSGYIKNLDKEDPELVYFKRICIQE